MIRTLKYSFAIIAAAIISMSSLSLKAQDCGDGTFRNPFIWGDFPDPDAIRVDDTFYLVTTSMHYFPGVTVMESKDLVNWSIAANAVPEMKAAQQYDMKGGNRYARGQWATSIRYFKGLYHLLFTTLDEGSFMCTASNPRGPWTLHKLKGSFYDPGLFVDNDGRVYVVNGNTNISVAELTEDGLGVKSESRPIYKAHRSGLEGNHCYHINDYYYIFCTYGGPVGSQICLRSKSIYGPFEEREVMNDQANYAGKTIHQGCLIPLKDGSWWSIIFQDHDGIGRVPFLVPVSWNDGWPVLGNMMNGDVRMKKPIQGFDKIDFPTSDEFSSTVLSPQWQFNHNPVPSKYNLNERKGWLRLYTVSDTDDVMSARNTITQRILGPYSEGTAKIDISKMKLGDKSGLMLLQSPNATMTVLRTNKGYELQMTDGKTIAETMKFNKKVIYLRANVSGVNDKVHFSYSYDDVHYTPFGKEFNMQYSLRVFCGNRYSIFNYATKQLGGYIDVDWFRVTQGQLLPTDEWAGKSIEAEYFDQTFHSKTRRSNVNAENRNQDVQLYDGGLIAFEGVKSSAETKQFTVNYSSEAPRATIQLRRFSTGELLVNENLPQTSGDNYASHTFMLSKPTKWDGERIEIIVWNNNGNKTVAIDNFKIE